MQKYKYILFLACLLVTSSIFANNADKKDSKKQALSASERKKFDYFFFNAMNAKVISDLPSAYDYLQYCNRLDSTNANVAYEIGNFYSLLEAKDDAFSNYQRAAKLDSTNYYYGMAYANACLESQQFKEAIKTIEGLAKINSDKPDLYLYLSEAYRLDGNLENAILALDKLEKNIGLNDKISLQKFQLYSAINQEDKAFAEIQKHIDRSPNDIRYQLLLGNLYLQANRNEEAKEVLLKARELEPDNPFVISSMADYYEKIGDKESAEKELKATILSPEMDIDSKLSILAQYVGTLQQNEKETKSANALFLTLMQQHPQEPKLNLMYGNLLLIQEDKNEAYNQFQIFAESHPTNPAGWEQMLAASFPDSISQAIKTCEEAIQNIPEEPIFYFYLGISQSISEDYQASVDNLKRGLKYVDPDNVRLISDFYGQMGDSYYQLNEVDSAFSYYDKSLEHNPSNFGILNNYSYFLSQTKKDLDKAEKMSGLTIKAEPTNPTYLDTYGWILFKQGAYTMSKIYIERALKLTEEQGEKVSGVLMEHMGDVLYMLDEKEEALQYWEKAKEAGGSESGTLDKKIETKSYIKSDANKK